MPGVIVPFHVNFFQTKQAKSPFILLNNKILHKPLVVKHPPFTTNVSFFRTPWD